MTFRLQKERDPGRITHLLEVSGTSIKGFYWSLGVLLLGLLAAAAWSAGITTFRAFVLEENEPMRDLLAQFGARVAYDSPGVVRIDVPLDPALLPDSPAARVLKASAAHVLETRARIPM